MDRAMEHTPQRAGPWTLFWSFFIATFLLLGGLYAFAKSTAGPDLYLAGDGEVYASRSFMDALERELPVVVGLMDAEFDAAAMDTDARVDAEIDALFAPVYAAVPGYLDRHYTVVGEYTELYSAAVASRFQEKTESLFEKMLFNETGFLAAREDTVARLYAFSDTRVDAVLDKVSDRLSSDLGLGDAEMSVLGEVAALTLEDTQTRISETALYRGVAASAGALVVIKLLSRRVAAKAVVKGSGKAAVRTGIGAAGGASAGAAGGLFCGPGAPICSTIGGIVGGAVGWFATDKIIVEVDEAINRDNFEAEIIAILDREKETLKTDLKAFFDARYEAIETHNAQSLEGIRLRDQIGPLTPLTDWVDRVPSLLAGEAGE